MLDIARFRQDDAELDRHLAELVEADAELDRHLAELAQEDDGAFNRWLAELSDEGFRWLLAELAGL